MNRPASPQAWTGRPQPWRGDAHALERALRGAVRGDVRFDAQHRAMYATDAPNYRQPPIGVVMPRDADDVVAAVAVCREHGAPILGRGGGTSLAGQCCNHGVVFDMSRHFGKVLEIDANARMARVQPGTILDVLRDTAKRQGLTFGPDPATHDHCTLGGMLGNNACGAHALMAGKMEANVHELEVLTYDGVRMTVGPTSDEQYAAIQREGGRRAQIYRDLRTLRDEYADRIRERFPDIPRRVSGFNLNELLPENGFDLARALVGTEGTCAMILQATLRLVPEPKARSLLVIGYEDVFTAGDHVMAVLEAGPIALEGIDKMLIDHQKKKQMHPEDLEMLPEGEAFLIVEFGGDSREEAVDKAQRLADRVGREQGVVATKVFRDQDEEQRVWEVRESGLGATARVPGRPMAWPGWEDSAVAPEKLGSYLRDLKQLFWRYGYDASLYGHFGQGCVHCRIDFDLLSAQGVETYRRFVADAADLVVRYGGSLSGEHGDGQARGELLPKMYGDEICEAFARFKAIWDPDGRMNPGKVVTPYPIVDNLKLGADYRPWEPRTHFKFPNDGGKFSRATLRCVGVGKCRREGGGTMCPSYMVTKEERHSTRGRAHLLWEMMQGDVVQDGWQSEAVKDALDLCLACKGCKGDCPVSVDLATYKAEFLAHYYEEKPRPRHAYTMGLIQRWAHLASFAPRLVNFVGHAPGLGWLAKKVGGIAMQRSLPRFATRTFRSWFRKEFARETGTGAAGGPRRERVVLWPDTFNDHWHPQIAIAAAESLRRLGFAVEIPEQRLCCGRPLYDYGMLDRAKEQLREILGALREPIRAGVAVVGLEPSCVSVFRDELKALFPDDDDAKRLSAQTMLLSEFLADRDVPLPRLQRKAVVHQHCHHKSVLRNKDELRLLDRMGLDCDVLDSGCCGMAGSFGFEPEKYDVSVACGERVLLPAVRAAAADTLLITGGFSCREQIVQCTTREPVHFAEVLWSALQEAHG